MIIIVTSEFVYNNPELNEVNDIIQRTRFNHELKYDCCGDVVVRSKVIFFEKRENKTEIFTGECCRNGIKRTTIASKGRYEFIEINK